MKILFLSAGLILLNACGQSGHLYLPPPTTTTATTAPVAGTTHANN